MDCKTASDLMMKYLDGEIDGEQQDILLRHLDNCELCHFEFDSMQDTIMMLDDIEMEEAPCDLEAKVISAIRKEDRVKAGIKGWSIGVLACIALLIGWFGLTAIILYTPITNVLSYCFNMFINGAGKVIELIAKIIYTGITTTARLASIGRAFSVMIADFRDVYNSIIAAIILFVAIISELYIYVQNTVRR